MLKAKMIIYGFHLWCLVIRGRCRRGEMGAVGATRGAFDGVGWTKDVLDKAGGAVGAFDAGYDGIGGEAVSLQDAPSGGLEFVGALRVVVGGEGRFDGLLGGGVIAMTENVFCAAMGGGKGVIAGVFVEVDHSVERTLW